MERRLISVGGDIATEDSPFTTPQGRTEPGKNGILPKSIRTIVTKAAATSPELHLLLAPDTFEPLYKSLFRGLDEFFFPKKLPPLKLESKPIPVKDIWGFYNYKKNGALTSTALPTSS